MIPCFHHFTMKVANHEEVGGADLAPTNAHKRSDFYIYFSRKMAGRLEGIPNLTEVLNQTAFTFFESAFFEYAQVQFCRPEEDPACEKPHLIRWLRHPTKLIWYAEVIHHRWKPGRYNPDSYTHKKKELDDQRFGLTRDRALWEDAEDFLLLSCFLNPYYSELITCRFLGRSRDAIRTRLRILACHYKSQPQELEMSPSVREMLNKLPRREGRFTAADNYLFGLQFHDVEKLIVITRRHPNEVYRFLQEKSRLTKGFNL